MKAIIFKGTFTLALGLVLMTTSNSRAKHVKNNSNVASTSSNKTSSVVNINGEKEFADKITNNSGKCIVKFFATWCGACKATEGPYKELAAKTPDITFAEVDVDQNQDLADKYTQGSIPHFVVFENGKKIKESIGFSPEKVNSLID